MKILMVCLGNICRSPLAQGIMEEKIRSRKLDWEVDSCGTGSWHIGENPDPRSIQVARQNNIDISHQRARQFKRSDLDHYDYILTMDTQNYNDLRRLADEDNISKIQLIMDFQYPGENRIVPDPYFNGGFEKVYQILDDVCDHFIEYHQVKN